MQLVQTSAYPRVIFECLLDQIEKLHCERRRAQLGEGEQEETDVEKIMQMGGDDGVVVDENGTRNEEEHAV